MRLDHIAFRVQNRKVASLFFQAVLGYRVQDEFAIDFDDGTKADCVALSPYEHMSPEMPTKRGPYYLPPELFVSDGKEGIVGDWVKERNGIGGIHHIAFAVPGGGNGSIEEAIAQWKKKGVEFSSAEPIRCPDEDMVQIFSKPIACLGGIVFELIQRGERGFCKSSVKKLMESSVEEGELT